MSVQSVLNDIAAGLEPKRGRKPATRRLSPPRTMSNYEVTVRGGEYGDSARIVSAPNRGAARWAVVEALRDLGFDTRDALRAVSVRATARPTPDEAWAAERDAWNAAYPVGTRVRFWPGAREGKGVVGEVRAPAQVVCGHVAAWVDTYHSCVAVSHIEALNGEIKGVEHDDV